MVTTPKTPLSGEKGLAMKTATLRQANKILKMLEDVPIEQVQKLLTGGYFPDLLKANVDEMNRIDFNRVCGLASKFIVTSAPFDPKTFEGLGVGWSEALEDRDERAYSLLEVDLARANFLSYLKEKEDLIKGEEKLRRLKASKDIRWGATQFAGLWKDYLANGKNSVLERAYQAKVITNYLDFFGTVLLSPNSVRLVPFLFRHRDGQWFWDVRWLRSDWGAGLLSASSSQA